LDDNIEAMKNFFRTGLAILFIATAGFLIAAATAIPSIADTGNQNGSNAACEEV
jgi:hypothetical protein